ncbi:MAG: Uma2 family endonuclease [Chloroflexota bacterium]
MAILRATIEYEPLDRRPYRFTIDQYHQMGEAGVFRPEDRVELIDGEIIEMNPIGDPHAGGVNRLNQAFVVRLVGKAVIAPQNPVRLASHDEPQPDLAILRFRADFYASLGPRPEDVLLLVEVADSSVSYDRRVKAPLYARNGIPEYWLVDLGRGQVVVYRDPSPDGYRSMQVHERGASLSLVELPDVTISVADILGGPAESA